MNTDHGGFRFALYLTFLVVAVFGLVRFFGQPASAADPHHYRVPPPVVESPANLLCGQDIGTYKVAFKQMFRDKDRVFVMERIIYGPPSRPHHLIMTVSHDGIFESVILFADNPEFVFNVRTCDMESLALYSEENAKYAALIDDANTTILPYDSMD